MKKKLISGLLSVLYAALMILSLFVPNGMASALVTALTWVACLLVWVVVLLCLAGWYAGGTHREEARQALTRFFSTPGNQGIRWARRSLLVIFLASTGHVVTLAFYLLTLATLKVLRAQVVDAEPVTV
ncbi:DNZ54_00345 family protein [Klebsiella michiganensis]|uniref:DNZ54_00345 family protein n=1 Tax=Klebsiella michiganensis TaxID=1134687 RepID=UPI0026590461|nr:DNZ54_00345 family protein [Klebsiella michiganensis]WKJ96807.1 DNZ54_00345 family protein [Klebsiella michiganensis]WKK05874.1 DNZ54_00345 family protein [Klebsiella michiganensis]